MSKGISFSDAMKQLVASNPETAGKVIERIEIYIHFVDEQEPMIVQAAEPGESFPAENS